MTAWLPTSSRLKFHDVAVSGQAFAGLRERWRVVACSTRDILAICSRGLAAAHYYEQLKPRSDADLAAKGLQRSGLPQAAFRKLTEQT
jgi:hypothetical protein